MRSRAGPGQGGRPAGPSQAPQQVPGYLPSHLGGPVLCFLTDRRITRAAGLKRLETPERPGPCCPLSSPRGRRLLWSRDSKRQHFQGTKRERCWIRSRGLLGRAVRMCTAAPRIAAHLVTPFVPTHGSKPTLQTELSRHCPMSPGPSCQGAMSPWPRTGPRRAIPWAVLGPSKVGPSGGRRPLPPGLSLALLSPERGLCPRLHGAASAQATRGPSCASSFCAAESSGDLRVDVAPGGMRGQEELLSKAWQARPPPRRGFPVRSWP